MARAAIYARYSSDLQRDSSLDDQIAAATRYALAQGWTIDGAHVFTDAAVSGVSLERPGLQRLLAAAATQPRPFDVLVVDDSSRISRDLADALHVLRELRFLGVRSIFVSQGIDSDHEQAEVLVSVHGLVDGLFLRELAQKVRRGLRGQVSRGLATGGRTYGYCTIGVPDPSGKRDPNGGPQWLGRRVEVVPADARVIQDVFAWFAAGLGVTTITDRLNRAGVASPRGGPWRRSAVRRILVNEKYRGRLIWGMCRFERVPGTRRKVARPQPRSEWQIHEQPALRIVSDDLWDAVQRRLLEVRTLTAPADGSSLMRGRSAALHSKNLFSGFLRCSVCGQSVTAVNAGHGSPRYGCGNSWRNGTTVCSNRLTVRAKVADPLLLEGLRAALTTPDMIAYVTQALAAALNATIDDRPRLLREAQTAREQTAARLQRLISAIESGVAPLTLSSAIREREADLARLDADIQTLSEPVQPRLAILPTWVAHQLQDLAGLLRETPERTKLEFRRLGLSILMQPTTEDGRTFYRAVGRAQLPALSGPRDLVSPTTVRSVERVAAARSSLRAPFTRAGHGAIVRS